MNVGEWAHRQFPAVADCRPVLVQTALEEAEYREIDAIVQSMWGLPVEVVVAAFALSACGGALAQAAKKPVDVQITLTEFKIESSVTDLAVGTPYHFVITNKGALAHDWMIMPSGEQDESKALIKVEDTDLPPNMTVTRDFTFTQPGDLEFACHVKGHYEAGMHTPITVK